MIKFTMNAKELKIMMDKVMTAVNKKVSVPSLKRLYFSIDDKGILKILSTDIDHYVEVRTKNVYHTEPGMLGIDIEDIKIISKMSGEITVEDITSDKEEKINIKCGKKNVSIPRFENTDVFLPVLNNVEDILDVKENWLSETISNLSVFVSNREEVNRMMSVFNFNTKEKRVEALWNCMIGMRQLEDDMILKETGNPFETVKLHCRCVPVFKKLLDKKSERKVIISQNDKYVKVESENFTYITKRIDGEYFKVNQMLSDEWDYKFTANAKELLEAMKYDADLLKESKLPVTFHAENGNLYSYASTTRYEAFGEIEVKEKPEKDFYIGFNPNFLVDIMSIVDSEYPVFYGTKEVCPWIINGDTYSFFILPVNIKDVKVKAEKRIAKYIEMNKTA
nr:MAG TPA: DNA polymerase III subunit beta [Bacteriophage sp.]